MVSAATVFNRVAKLHPGQEILRDPRFQGLLDEIRGGLSSARPQGLASIAWSMAKLRCREEIVVGSRGICVILLITSFGAQELANTAWAVARLALQKPALISAILEQSGDDVVDLRPQEPSNRGQSFVTPRCAGNPTTV
jgi:hypothetical protein